MSECIAMAVGFALGAAYVLVSQRTSKVCESGELRAEQSPAPAEATEDSGTFGEQLQKQWDNFLNYEGSEYGQIPLGDE